MRTHSLAWSGFSSCLVAALAVLGCQSADFEPVEPLAWGQTTLVERRAVNVKPNIMLLVDSSGSMADPSCSGCSTTRWQELQGAVSRFLADVGTQARFGLTNYPADNVCGPAGRAQVHFDVPDSDDAQALQAQVDGIQNTLQSVLRPQGGTPSGESVKFVGQLPSMQDPDRPNYIFLLTDGLPNCNAENPISGAEDPAACKCTLASGCTTAPSTPDAPDFRRLGCLDAGVSAQRIAEVHARGIRTVVIGFGALLTGNDAEQTLNAMALAGGFPNGCVGSGPCHRYFPASDEDELREVLNLLFEQIADPCSLYLEPQGLPSDPYLMLVKLTDPAGTQTLESGRDYFLELDGSPRVRFAGESCERIRRSTPSAPVTLEVYTIQRK